MMLRKTILALLLLLTYTAGFTHSFLPHCEEIHFDDHFTTHQESSHPHAHHEHTSDEEEHQDHSHIQHMDHFDEDLLDLVECFLSEIPHAGENCDLNYHLAQNTGKKLTQKTSLTKCFLPAELLVKLNKKISSIPGTEKASLYRAPALIYAPLRGPPAGSE